MLNREKYKNLKFIENIDSVNGLNISIYCNRYEDFFLCVSSDDYNNSNDYNSCLYFLQLDSDNLTSNSILLYELLSKSSDGFIFEESTKVINKFLKADNKNITITQRFVYIDDFIFNVLPELLKGFEDLDVNIYNLIKNKLK